MFFCIERECSFIMVENRKKHLHSGKFSNILRWSGPVHDGSKKIYEGGKSAFRQEKKCQRRAA
jgi:hypothetical protein